MGLKGWFRPSSDRVEAPVGQDDDNGPRRLTGCLLCLPWDTVILSAFFVAGVILWGVEIVAAQHKSQDVFDIVNPYSSRYVDDAYVAVAVFCSFTPIFLGGAIFVGFLRSSWAQTPHIRHSYSCAWGAGIAFSVMMYILLMVMVGWFVYTGVWWMGALVGERITGRLVYAYNQAAANSNATATQLSQQWQETLANGTGSQLAATIQTGVYNFAAANGIDNVTATQLLETFKTNLSQTVAMGINNTKGELKQHITTVLNSSTACNPYVCLDMALYPVFNGDACICDPQTITYIHSLCSGIMNVLYHAGAGELTMVLTGTVILMRLASYMTALRAANRRYLDAQVTYYKGGAPGPLPPGYMSGYTAGPPDGVKGGDEPPKVVQV